MTTDGVIDEAGGLSNQQMTKTSSGWDAREGIVLDTFVTGIDESVGRLWAPHAARIPPCPE